MDLYVECCDRSKILETLTTLCRETEHFCYTPRDHVEMLLSLSWAETIQYVESGCTTDVYCSSNILDSFATVLSLAMECKYVFNISTDLVKTKLKLLKTGGGPDRY